MIDETTLLPCPFCGGEAEICHVRDICSNPEDWYWGKCLSCHISGRHYPTEAEAITAWNARAELVNGTLTAEQVHDAVLENFEETHETRYDHWEPSKFDWQAIADELNAELGSGTCKITATATNNLMYPDYMTKWYELSCGHSLTLKGDEAPKWCAVCGAKVIQGVDNAD